MPPPIDLQLGVGHIITIIVVLLGYLTASLLAWGRLTTEVHGVQKAQESMVSKGDLSAAVSEMKVEMYRAMNGTDRRKDTAHE